ncbi:sulfatase-like hydrolase/transferase [Hymenobacter negativus]|uniref:Sulfatase-like hydrolase/transferase n=1 Tax=Hymenobacter negativus TaxID=2795026 RepID=A0ABS3QJ85_9BACT|nr:sulfatase-like hydrolase/transferase [Hymenobacter negativus]MBO2011312.1 sulfatase-like hydrolase/transferase [Hymenobacter negativus]
MRPLTGFLTACLTGLALTAPAQTPKLRTENVVLITLDGMRWQEVFGGADTALFRQTKQYYTDRKRLQKDFGQGTPKQRRQTLMPFLWNTVAKQGQLYGNRPAGSLVNVTNTMRFSYPGYNEILTGAADDARIHSNDPLDNPNASVLEVLNQQPAFRGKVAAFGSWDAYPYILNEKRSGLPVNAGQRQATGAHLTPGEILLNQLEVASPSPFGEERLDAFTYGYAFEYLKKNKPRVLYIGFGDTDDWAHGGEYGAYLHAAQYTDDFIRQLWAYLQSDPQYRGKTTLLITTDHGRGIEGTQWQTHGRDVVGADQIWMAALGPDTPVLSKLPTGQLYQNQVAATLAQLLGQTYTPTPATGKPVEAMLGRK